MQYAKKTDKSLKQQIDVVAQFHAHKILPQRIAYRTGISLDLVNDLINGELHTSLFNSALARHRKNRRDQRLKQSYRLKGIAQAELQDKIMKEY